MTGGLKVKIEEKTPINIKSFNEVYLILITHSAASAMYDVPYSDDFASAVVAVEQLRIAAVPQPEHNHCAYEYKSMCGSQ